MPYRALSAVMAAVDRDHIPRDSICSSRTSVLGLRADTDVPGSIVGEIGTVIVFPFLDRIPSLSEIDQYLVIGFFGLQ